MERFLVRPSGPLHGTVEVYGAKNSVLKCMAATLLAAGHHVIENVPRITDVEIARELLHAMGVGSSFSGSGRSGTLEIDVPGEITPVAPYELVEKIRASIVFLGPLLARHGSARMSLPGGDDFGQRPIDMHVRAFEEMGTIFTTEHGYLEGRSGRLSGTRVVFQFPSHTSTDNVMMAATLAKGTTVIENAAREPEVIDLAEMLTSMGAQISGAGTSRIEIEGRESLHPARHVAISDRVEAATFLAAVGLAGGEIELLHANAEHMEMLIEKLSQVGVDCTDTGSGIRASGHHPLRSVDVSTLPYPGVATDYKPFLVSMLSVASGVAIVTENIFAGRFRYVDELRRMGADIVTRGHHAVVRGVPRLSGAEVRCTDIRAGAALLLAGMVADGVTEISGTAHVDRGYEDLAGRLSSIGAEIERVDE